MNKERYTKPASTVDLIVPFHQGIVLIQRKNEPFKGFWALPGGFLDYGAETLEEAACRELQEETGLKTQTGNLALVGVYSEPDRDPGDHVISHVYYVKKLEGQLCAADDAYDAKVFSILPDNLAFDHARILHDFLQKQKEISNLKDLSVND